MTNDEFLDKYQNKLARAWRSGATDAQAAKHAGVTEDELNEVLKESKSLREVREALVDTLLVKAQKNIAKKIQEGDVKVSEWYIEKMDYRFGGKKVEGIPEEDQEELDDFLDGFTAKGKFDERQGKS